MSMTAMSEPADYRLGEYVNQSEYDVSQLREMLLRSRLATLDHSQNGTVRDSSLFRMENLWYFLSAILVGIACE